jgi:hypothetical protein
MLPRAVRVLPEGRRASLGRGIPHAISNTAAWRRAGFRSLARRASISKVTVLAAFGVGMASACRTSSTISSRV